MLKKFDIKLMGRILAMVMVVIVSLIAILTFVSNGDAKAKYDYDKNSLTLVASKVAGKLDAIQNPGPEWAADTINEDGIRPEIAESIGEIPEYKTVLKKAKSSSDKKILRSLVNFTARANQSLIDSVGDRAKTVKAVDDYTFGLACARKMYGSDGALVITEISRRTRDTDERRYKALAAGKALHGRITEGIFPSVDQCIQKLELDDTMPK